MSFSTVRWLVAAALGVALVIDFRDGDPFKLLGTALLTAAAVLFATGSADRRPPVRLLMFSLVGAAVVVLLYRLFFRHA